MEGHRVKHVALRQDLGGGLAFRIPNSGFRMRAPCMPLFETVSASRLVSNVLLYFACARLDFACNADFLSAWVRPSALVLSDRCRPMSAVAEER